MEGKNLPSRRSSSIQNKMLQSHCSFLMPTIYSRGDSRGRQAVCHFIYIYTIYTSDSSMDRFRTTTFQYHGTIKNVSFRPEVSTTAIDDEESDATHGRSPCNVICYLPFKVDDYSYTFHDSLIKIDMMLFYRKENHCISYHNCDHNQVGNR